MTRLLRSMTTRRNSSRSWRPRKIRSSAHSHSCLIQVNRCVSGTVDLENVAKELHAEVDRFKAENHLLEGTNRSLRAQIESSSVFSLLLSLLD